MKKLKCSLPISLFLLTILATSVFALESSSSASSPSSAKKTVKDVVAQKKEEVKAAIQEKNETLKELRTSKSAELKAKTAELKASKSAELRASIQDKRLALQNEIKAKKAEMEQKIKIKKDDFKARVAALKDEKKQEVVTRLDEKIAAINKRRTDEQTKHLERLTGLLDKIKNRAAKAESAGVDVSSVSSLITAAQSAIDSARTVVVTQSAKQYVITITTESALGQAVSSTKQELFNDLKTSHNAVQTARVAVEKALTTLGSLTGVDNAE